MKSNMRIICAGICFVILLIPFFLGATGAHPATDDFTFATYTHPTYVKTGSLLHVLKDALSYTLRTWRDWQGTVTGVFFMALNPAVFSLEFYGVHAVLLLILHLVAWALFLHHFLAVRVGLPGRTWLFCYFVLAACSLVFLPDIVEGIYWYNGAWFYTGAQAVALMTLVLCDLVVQGRQNDRYGILRILCWILLFALGLDNYITAMMCWSGVLILVIVCLQVKTDTVRSYTIRTALSFMIPITAGLILSVIAPGNQVRMATDGAHENTLTWFINSVLQTFWAGFYYTGRFLVKTPLLAFLLGITPELLLLRTGRLAKRGKRWVAGAIACYFLIFFAMLFPHIYSSGYAGSGRVINMYHDYVLLVLPLVYCLCIPEPKVIHEKICRWPWLAAATAAMVLCLYLGQQKNYVKLVRDQITGVQAIYAEQFKQEYDILEAAEPDTDVILPAWRVQTVTGKPTAETDPMAWTNESMAAYFGVKSIRVEKDD